MLDSTQNYYNRVTVLLKLCNIRGSGDPRLSASAMKTSVGIILLALACICTPSPTSAQAPSYGDPNVVSVRELSIPPKAQHEFDEGMRCLQKRDPAGSLPHFQRAVLEYAGYYEALDRIGAAQLKLSHLPEAEEAFRKSIEVSGGQFAHPFFALGAILDEREQFAEAASVTGKGLGLDPNSWTGHYYLALAQMGLDRLADAEKSLQESLQHKADFAQAYLMLAEIHARKKNYRSLVVDLDAYLKLEPDGPSSDRAKAMRQAATALLGDLQSSQSSLSQVAQQP